MGSCVGTEFIKCAGRLAAEASAGDRYVARKQLRGRWNDGQMATVSPQVFGDQSEDGGENFDW
jgi:hypothetical protein